MDSLEALLPFIPIDRRLEMAGELVIPEETTGAALFADISGFTRLTILIVEKLGRKRGAEEVLPILNRIYDGLIAQVHDFRGTVIGFSGDAITCWFDGDDGSRAVAVGLAMQREMQAFAEVEAPGAIKVALAVKVTVSSGRVRRFVVGDPRFSRIDVVAGSVVEQMAQAERVAGRGEVLVTEPVASALEGRIGITEWRPMAAGLRAGVVGWFSEKVDPDPWPAFDPSRLTMEKASQWVLPTVAAWMNRGPRAYLAEIRPAVALFARFGGIDFDGDPAAQARLDAYIRWVQDTAARYDGSMIQLTIGDKGSYFYITFGAPVAHADDALRALAAATLLQEPPDDLGYVGQVQIGIASGQMRAGTYGGHARWTYGSLGEKVNLAAGLMGVAPRGEIYCDSSVYAATRHQSEFVVVDNESVRKQAKGPLGAVYSLKGTSTSDRSLPEVSHTLVGRELEVGRFVSLLEQSLDGSPKFMSLCGDAGLGKSRLVAEYCRLASDRGFKVLLGFSSSIEPLTPYRIWREMLNRLFDLERGVARLVRIKQVKEGVEAFAPELKLWLPLLNDMLNLGIPENELTSQMSPAQRLENLSRLVIALLRGRLPNQPMLLVFEDVHWMDRLSWELSLQVATAFQGKKGSLMMVWVSRPSNDYPVTFQYQEKLEALDGLELLDLTQLTNLQVRQLVANELEVEADRVQDGIFEAIELRAQGNPFYAQEMVYTFQNRGVIERAAAGRWQFVPDHQDRAAAIPDNLQGLVLDRIDRLEPEARTLLKVASVVGRSFPASAVVEVLSGEGQIQQDVRALLANLAARKMLVEDPDRQAYHFQHIITRDVAYETLLYAQRRELHREVGGWYEGYYDLDSLAEHYPLLVYHFRQAEVPDKELVYLHKAADQSQGRFANQEALAYLERALELCDEDRERFDIQLQREEILGLVGDRERQAAVLKQAAGLSDRLDDLSCRATLHIRQAIYDMMLGHYGDALDHAESAIRIGEMSDRGELVPVGEQLVGRIQVQLGQYDSAIARFDQALRGFKNEAHAKNQVQVLVDYGLALVYKGAFQEAIPRFEEAIRLSEEHDFRPEAMKAYANLGNVYFSLGDHQKYLDYYLETLDVSRQIGDRRAESIVIGNLGILFRIKRSFDKALSNLALALQISREVGDIRKEGTWLGNMGLIYYLLGDLDRSLDHYQKALEISREIGNRNGEHVWLGHMGNSYREKKEYPAALEYVKSGLEICRSVGNRNEESFRLYEMGLVYWDLRDSARAQQCLVDSLEIKQQLNQPHWEIECLAALSLIALENQELDRAIECVEKILGYLEENPTLEGTNYPRRVLVACYRVLKELSDPRAQEVLFAAHRMMVETANLISDPLFRDSFLNSVPENQEILAALSP